jgi:Cdc6-like AAA superfamily ATPase
MARVEPLAPAQLCAHCDPGQFAFKTTDDLEDLAQVLGQARAIEALRFGIGIQRSGYNLYVLGAPGTGRHTVVRQFLDDKAAREPVPSEWCYVNNFEEAHKPRVICLPAGTGVKLRRDIEQLMNDLHAAIQAAFES